MSKSFLTLPGSHIHKNSEVNNLPLNTQNTLLSLASSPSNLSKKYLLFSQSPNLPCSYSLNSLHILHTITNYTIVTFCNQSIQENVSPGSVTFLRVNQQVLYSQQLIISDDKILLRHVPTFTVPCS